MMRIGSLFSGIGGLELGLEWAGVGRTVWQVERDSYCRQVLAHHWPEAQRFDDVCTVGAHNLPPVDVMCGGFPCQDISYAGKGAGLAGARSGLWYEYARIVGELEPRFVVVENVSALLTRGIDAVLGTLADLGYNAEWSTLRASDVGAPHRRERVFIVAYAAELFSDGGGVHGRGVRQARGAVPELGDCDSVVGDAEGARLEGYPRHGDKRSESRRLGSEQARPVAGAIVPVGWDDATPVRGADGTVRLIPAEAAAAGPESPLWPVADGVPGRVARLRAIGNAVVPQCAKVVGRRLLEIAREHAQGGCRAS